MVAVKPGRQREHSTPVRLLVHKADSVNMSKGDRTSQLLDSMSLHPQKPAGQRVADVGEYDMGALVLGDVFLKKSHMPVVTLKSPVQDTMP